MRFVALLRGVNVSGKNKILMADLKQFFVDAGAEDPSTFINSGNVIFSASQESFAAIQTSTRASIEKHFGKPIPVVFRSAEEIAEAIAANPFLGTGANERDLFVMFLEHEPTTAQLESLDPNRSPGDFYVVLGKQIYQHLGTGAADTKLTNAYFDSKLKTISTARNWNTVQRLHALMQS